MAFFLRFKMTFAAKSFISCMSLSPSSSFFTPITYAITPGSATDLATLYAFSDDSKATSLTKALTCR